MRDSISEKTGRWIKIIFFIGLAAALIPILSYLITFGPGSGFKPPRNDVAWANLGSFIGGLLGPVFAFFAFVGVLVTIWLQAKQLDTSKNQAVLEEIQQVISNISSKIDTFLAQAPNSNISNHRLANAPITIFTLISAAGTAALSTPDNYISQASRDQFIAEAKSAFQTESTIIGLELEQLVWCLNEYHKHHGSQTVIEFYKRRYLAIVCWLDAFENLDSHAQVQDYFKPKDNRKFLTKSEPSHTST